MRMMTNTLIIVAGLYLLLCGVLFLMQDKLIFFPPKPVADVYDKVSGNEIVFSEAGQKIYGWKINVNPGSSKTMLYFGGNAEDVVYLNFEAENFNTLQIFAMNHPGYGKNQGEPSQKVLYKNALYVYDHIIQKYELNPENIIIVGRSLGSSVATYLAAKRKAAGLVLITPFDSIKNIAANQYKIFPIKYMIKHVFPTIEYIIDVKTPILMLAAEHDEMISDVNLQNLQNATSDNARLIRYSGVGHNTIQTHHQYYNEINRFIESF